MSLYSKIFHHISVDDVKQKRLDNIIAEKLRLEEKLEEEKKEKKLKEYITSASEKLKSNWIQEMMTTGSVMVATLSGSEDNPTEVVTIDASLEASFEDGPDNGLQNMKFKGSIIKDGGSGSGDSGGFNIGKHLGISHNQNSDGSAWNSGNSRHAMLAPIDASEVDTLVISAIRGNDSNGGELPDADNEDLRVMWFNPNSGGSEGGDWQDIDYENTSTQHDDVNITIIPRFPRSEGSYNASDADAYPGLRDWKIEIPEWCRNKNQRFGLYQHTNSGSGYDHYGIKSVRYERRSPMNVVVALDRPEASSFVRLDISPQDKVSSPRKRKKKVDDILKSSKEYVNKVIADPFPGTDAEIGVAQGTGDPYIKRGWDETTGQFAVAGTLDQQLDKFIETDSEPLPNQKSYESISDEELEWNDLGRNEKGEVVRVMPPIEERSRRWETVPYKDQYGFEDGPPVGLWPPHENAVTLPATKTWVNPKTGHRYEANNQNFGVDPNSGWVNPEPGYGDRIGTSPQTGWTAQHLDKDRDGVDDRDQVGPGQPYVPWPFPRDGVPPKDPDDPRDPWNPPPRDPDDPWVPPIKPPRPPIDPIPPKDPIDPPKVPPVDPPKDPKDPPPDDPKDPPKKPPIDLGPPRKYPPIRDPKDIPIQRPIRDEYDLKDPKEYERFNRDKEAYKEHTWKLLRVIMTSMIQNGFSIRMVIIV